MFTRPQTQVGPCAAARILIASRSRAVARARTGNQIPYRTVPGRHRPEATTEPRPDSDMSCWPDTSR